MKKRRSRRRISSRRSKYTVSKIYSQKEIKNLSKEHLMLIFETVLHNVIISKIIQENFVFNKITIQRIISNTLYYIISDVTCIYIIDRLFGSHKYYDIYKKIILWIGRILIPFLYIFTKYGYIPKLRKMN